MQPTDVGTRIRLPRDAAAIAAARSWVSETIRARHALRPERVEATLVMVSELVTNVILHTEAEPEIVVADLEDQVVVEVRDDDPAEPVVQEPDPQRAGGNGLRIVASWAERWGVRRLDDGGKVVWFSVPVRE
ncbi:MAG: histidine kinase [Acidimicrobiales bacterium]|nr:histidine kinase [Acidimicrobiales bacterium]